MGVKGLETFMKSVPNGQKMVNILNEIKQWKSGNPNKKCLIVIDLFGIYYSHLKEDLLCGFRYNTVINRIEHFLKQLIDAGAELKFFVDGFRNWDSIEHSLNLRNEYYEVDQTLFNILGTDVPLDQMQREWIIDKRNDMFHIIDNEIACSLKTVVDNRIQLSKYGDLYHFAKGKCDREMVIYATKNNAFAILTNDSDFLMFPGIWKVWNSRKLAIDELTVIEYNKSVLISYLKIESYQLPIMATLMGTTKQFPQELASKFHNYMGHFKFRFINTAKYIQRHKIQSSSKTFRYELFKIAKFMDSERSKEVYEMMLKSIEYYACDNLEEESSEIKTKLRYLGSFGYDLYTFPYYIPKLRFCNYKKRYGFPTHSDVIISIVCRAYGFILTLFNSERSIASKMITTKENYESKFEMKSYDAEYPSKELKYPKYPAFYEDFSDDVTKMKILLWIFGIDDSKCDQILNQPDSITPDLLSLLYFTERGLIDNDVADSCLITCYAEAFKLIPKNVEYPKYVDEKLYTFSKLYSLIYQNLTKCARMINFQKLCGILTFDSVYFQWTHQEFGNNELNNKRVEFMDKIKPFRIYDPSVAKSDSNDPSIENENIKLKELSLNQKV